MPSENSNCYCGNASPFEDCCLPIIEGQKQASTAEQLMRSRYSAFASAHIDYLISSHHPSKRTPQDHAELSESLRNCQWLSLRIVSCKRGQANDDEGEVEFIASFRQHGEQGLLHENSRFTKIDGQWFYVDGDMIDTAKSANTKIGRNDPCWCGSGVKFKKCHG